MVSEVLVDEAGIAVQAVVVLVAAHALLSLLRWVEIVVVTVAHHLALHVVQRAVALTSLAVTVVVMANVVVLAVLRRCIRLSVHVVVRHAKFHSVRMVASRCSVKNVSFSRMVAPLHT